MKKDALFRTCVFGGYNKEDVNEYIKRLEDELIKAKKENEGVGNRDFVPGQGMKKEDSDIVILSEILGVDREEQRESFFESNDLQTQKESDNYQEEANARLMDMSDRLAEMKKQYEKAEQELKDKDTQLSAVLRKLAESEKQSSGDCVEELEMLKNENKNLQSEVDALKKEKESYEEDYKAVKNVLLNARVDAEIILAKAQEKAKLVMETSQKQIEDKRRESFMILARCLEDNQNSLIVSKGYLEEQVKNIERAQREILVLEEDMKKLKEESRRE